MTGTDRLITGRDFGVPVISEDKLGVTRQGATVRGVNLGEMTSFTPYEHKVPINYCAMGDDITSITEWSPRQAGQTEVTICRDMGGRPIKL